MKIGIIGASGKAGSLIALEAKQRRHEVTAIVRNKAKVEGKGLHVIEKDLFDLTLDDLKGFDVVVDAFGTAFDPESAQAHQTSLKYLTDLMAQLPDVRLMVVGGAASLYTDRSRSHLVFESIPKEWQAVPANMKAAFEELKKSGAKWTYFSPAATFDVNGPRTGKYKLGNDVMIFNSDKESYLSYADYAVAMLDEIEEGNFIGKRFTAVSEKTANKDGYYGTENKKPVFEGISTYRPHLNFELSGKCFHLLMDRTGELLVKFLNDTMIEFTQGGKTCCEPYQCAKGAELAYFVNFEIKGSKPRNNVTLIIDLQTNLVTVVNTYTGFNERYPTMCDSDYDFGAIDLPDCEPPRKRHGYTADLVGKRIHWHYSPDFSIVHCYYHPNYVRATFDPKMIDRLPPSTPENEEAWKDNPYDEKAVYVKIREGL
ncbi:MAG: NAD(P)H-binding protein, partial [Eubacteriales bacterium]|nr:NAD(P)H-binding protein [Eubacteriales bacterium]